MSKSCSHPNYLLPFHLNSPLSLICCESYWRVKETVVAAKSLLLPYLAYYFSSYSEFDQLKLTFTIPIWYLNILLPTARQTLLFSATFSREVRAIAATTLRKGYTIVDTVGEEVEQTHSHGNDSFYSCLHIFLPSFLPPLRLFFPPPSLPSSFPFFFPSSFPFFFYSFFLPFLLSFFTPLIPSFILLFSCSLIAVSYLYLFLY